MLTRRHLAAAFAALAHPHRGALLLALADGPMPASEIPAAIGTSVEVAAKAVAILKIRGAIESVRHGQRVDYRLTELGEREARVMKAIGELPDERGGIGRSLQPRSAMERA